MDVDAHFAAEFDEHALVLTASRGVLGEAFLAMHQAWTQCIRNGCKIMLFGNGGSAADAQHLATELAARYKKDRAPIAAIALTTDSSMLTAISNDFAFDQVFARQIEALGRPGDVAVGISTSGRSKSIIEALTTARRLGLKPTAFSGGDGGLLRGLAEPLIVVPSKTTARIQEMHILLGHMLCGALEIELGLV